MKNILKYGIFLVGALSLLTLNASALSNPSNDSIEPENNSNEPIEIGICIDFELYTHEELSKFSDTIIIGTVKEILSPKWNTVDGKQPNKARNKLIRENTIYTDIIINVDEYLKNPLSSKEVTVRTIGGKIGNINLTTDADPGFKVGEKTLLFLSKDNSSDTKDFGPEHFIVTNFYRGKYTLTDDGKAITPDENTTLEELLSTINQTVNETNDTGILDNIETVNETNDTGILENIEKTSKQEENLTSIPESKNAPFINSFWALAVLLGAVPIIRHRYR